MTGWPEDQPRIPGGPCDPLAGMHAAFTALVGLANREETGRGSHFECAMIEGSLNAAAEQVIEYTAYGNILEREGNRAPEAAPQGLYPCQGVERWRLCQSGDHAPALLAEAVPERRADRANEIDELAELFHGRPVEVDSGGAPARGRRPGFAQR